MDACAAGAGHEGCGAQQDAGWGNLTLVAPPAIQAEDFKFTVVAAALTVLLCALWLGASYLLLAPDAGLPLKQGRRLPVIDNAKLLLTTLVVLDHFKMYWGWDWGMNAWETWTQLHTRTFCFLSGVVAREPMSRKLLRYLAFRLAAPFVLWSTVGPFLDIRWIATGRPWEAAGRNLLAVSHWDCEQQEAAGLDPLWYLFALMCWQLCGAALRMLPAAARLGLALACSAACGYMSAFKCTALEPAGVYLPIFVAGQLFPLERIVARLPQTRSRVSAGLAFLVGVSYWQVTPGGFAMLWDGIVPVWGWSGRAYGGHWAAASFWLRGLFRHAFELSRGLALLLLLCPRGPGWMADFGRESVYPFLLNTAVIHWLAVLAHVGNLAFPMPTGYTARALMWLAALTFSLLLSVMLSSSPVRRTFGCLFEPTWLERLCIGKFV